MYPTKTNLSPALPFLTGGSRNPFCKRAGLIAPLFVKERLGEILKSYRSCTKIIFLHLNFVAKIHRDSASFLPWIELPAAPFLTCR